MKQNDDNEDISILNDVLEESAETAERFLNAPRKAQELFFVGVELTDVPMEFSHYNLELPYIPVGLTPIEAILHVAYQDYTLFINHKPENLICYYDIYISNGKHYVADFYHKQANLVIECDGHDFHHKTKKQVEHDNERELDLKMAGYNIVRFSGSQIYNKPFECAKELYNYIQKLMRGEN